jgi:hypothetical protein
VISVRKPFVILSILLLMSFLLSGCKANPVNAAENRSTLGVVNNLDGVTMTVQKGSTTSTGLSLVFRNTGQHNGLYGKAYSLDVLIEGIWYHVPYAVANGGTFVSIGYGLDPGATTYMDVDWSWLYGKLPAGDYRIIKGISDFRGSGDSDEYILAAEFSLK